MWSSRSSQRKTMAENLALALKQQQIAGILMKIVEEVDHDTWPIGHLRVRVWWVAKKAEDMGLWPDDVLGPDGSAAFSAIARVVLPLPAYTDPKIPRLTPMNSAWSFIVSIVGTKETRT